jgi:pimeloyl-ACP methyl ester carboxylesterase
MDQDIRFCSAPDGVRIAYASVGQGPPLVKTANWLNHLEYDWRSPIWAPLFLELSKSRRLLRYDERGNGLSDWSTDDLSFEKMVMDLESVVDTAGLDSFDLFGVSQGCAVSIAYAVRHPNRVQKLLLYGGYARGWAWERSGAPWIRGGEPRRRAFGARASRRRVRALASGASGGVPGAGPG